MWRAMRLTSTSEPPRLSGARQASITHLPDAPSRSDHQTNWRLEVAYSHRQSRRKLERILQQPDSKAATANGFLVTRLAFRSGKQAYRNAYGKELSGEPGPRPVAAADKRVLGVVVRGYFVAKAP